MSNWIDVVKGECSWIKIYYGVLANYMKIKDYKNVIEIGVAYGGHAVDLLENTECEYLGIDPYQPNYDPKDFFDKDVHRIMKGRDKAHSMELLYQGVLDRISPYGDRAKIERRSSWDAALLLDDESYDVVFIDGNHTYDAVKSDINLFWSKIRSGGTMAGDDYDWPDVKRAVHEFANENNLKVQRMRNSKGREVHWYFEKP